MTARMLPGTVSLGGRTCGEVWELSAHVVEPTRVDQALALPTELDHLPWLQHPLTLSVTLSSTHCAHSGKSNSLTACLDTI